jgi:transposase
MKVVEKKAKDEMAERPGETEGARRATGVFPGGAPLPGEAAPGRRDVEVVAKAERRRFTAEFKRRIVREADRCTKPGEIGALLRREGLYSSHLVTWRAARDRGELEGLSPKQRGPKAPPPDPREQTIAEQEREIARLRKRAERAEALVELQKKLAVLLGTPFESAK